MPSPRISVVIPLYNKEFHIGRAVRSVLGQSFQDFEIVIVDDGSTDGGAAVAGRMGDPRIRLIRKANGGVSSARNRGIEAARAELIAFLDADDSWKPEFLSVIGGLAARHASAGAYGTAFEIVDPSGRTTVSRTASLRAKGPTDVLIRDYFREALSGFVIWTSATAVPKRTFAEVGLFPEGVSLGEDLDMWLRIGARFPIAVSGYVGSVYHKEAANRADVGRIKGFEFEHVRTGLRLLSTAPFDRKRKRHLQEYVAMYQIMTAGQMILAGRRDEAMIALKGCRTRKFLVQKYWWQFWALLPTRAALEAHRIKRTVLDAFAGMPEAGTERGPAS